MYDRAEGEPTSVAGSYGYMAPEVFNGSTYDEKADIFSLGVLIYNLCYRIIPSLLIIRDGDHMNMIVYAKKVSEGFRQPLNNRRIPKELNDVIAACWDEDPSKRPDAATVFAMLKNLLSTGASVALPCDGHIIRRLLISLSYMHFHKFVP